MVKSSVKIYNMYAENLASMVSNLDHFVKTAKGFLAEARGEDLTKAPA
jgi:hypothetical protein